MTRKQTVQHSLLQLLWPPLLLLLVKPLQVSNTVQCMLRFVTLRQRAHSMLLCVAHAAVLMWKCRSMSIRLIGAQTGTGGACCAATSFVLASHTGRMKAEERTSHVSCDLTERMLLPARPLHA